MDEETDAKYRKGLAQGRTRKTQNRRKSSPGVLTPHPQLVLSPGLLLSASGTCNKQQEAMECGPLCGPP